MREGDERKTLDEFIQAFEVVPIDAEIAIRGGLFRRDYRRSHNVGIADALNAAVAIARNISMVTLTSKHYPMLPTVVVPYQKST